jgi:O-antigen/teichoic acid export membrane protein
MIARASRLIARYSHLNWALADQSLVSGVNFLTGIMLARFLGLEEFGRFTLAWMAVMFVNSIQQAVIVQPMMSIGPKQEAQDEPAYYGALAAHQLAFGAVAFALVWGGATAAAAIMPHWNIAGLALPLASAALAFQCQDFLRRYFFTRGRGAIAFATDGLRYGGQLVVLFWLFRTSAMDSAATLWVIAALAATAAAATLPACERMQWRLAAIRATTKHHWHFSKWLAGSALMQWTSGQLFFIAAGAILGATAVGALKAAQTLMGVTHILFMGLENVVPVRAARHFHKGGKEALSACLKRVTLLGEGAIAAFAAVAVIAPNFWLGLVFGYQYLGYGYLLQLFAVLYLLTFLGLPLRAGLRAVELTRIFFWAQVNATVASVLVVYPIVKFFGLTGVLVGLLLAQAVSLTTQFSGFRKILHTIPA